MGNRNRKKKKSIQCYQRDMAWMEKHFQSQCLVCLGGFEVPSSRLSCCRKRVHECLLKWFVHSEGQMRTSCPHCKQSIFPFNLTEGPLRCIPLGSFPFAFTHVHFAPLQPRLEDFESHFLNLRPIRHHPRVVWLSPAWSGYACLGSKLKCKL